MRGPHYDVWCVRVLCGGGGAQYRVSARQNRGFYDISTGPNTRTSTNTAALVFY